MTQKPKIQYIGQFYVHGSEAQALAPKDKKKKARTRLPLAKLEKIEKVYVDPVALGGIVVAVVMLVVMVFGALQIQKDWEAYEVMSNYVSELNRKNAALEHTYRMGYDLEEVEAKALAIGLVPKDEVQTITVKITPPETEPEETLWDDIVWFFKGLFA